MAIKKQDSAKEMENILGNSEDPDQPFKNAQVQSPEMVSKMSQDLEPTNAEKDSNGGIAIQTSSKTLPKLP